MLRNVRRALRGRKYKEERPAKRTSKIPYFLLAAAVSLPVLPPLRSPMRLPVCLPKDRQQPQGHGTALVQAAESGERTEVLSQRSETTQVFANPDGTLTQDTYALPQWVRQGKKLAEIDTTLQHRSNGRYAARATEIGVAFSGGATGPRHRGQGRPQHVWSCPGNCPGPRECRHRHILRGPTGVDLKLKADQPASANSWSSRTPRPPPTPS